MEMEKDTLSILKDIERGDISIEDAEGELIKSLDSQVEDEQVTDEQVAAPEEPTEETEEKNREPGNFPTRRERKLALAKKNQEWEPQVMIGQSESCRWPWENLSWQWMWQNFGYPVYIEHSIDVTEGGQLQIVSYQGDLFIRGWDQPSLRINGAVFDARIGQEDNTIRLASSTGQLHIWIPAGITSVSVRTEPGDIWLSNIAANVEVNCQSGDLICQRLEGSIDAESDGGDVRLMGVEGAVKVDIARGNCDVRSIASSDVSLKSTEGDLWLNLDSVRNGQFRCEAVGGDINLLTNGELSCELLVEVTDGGMISPTILPWKKLLERSESKLHGILMDGGANINLKASDGRIYIQESTMNSFPIPSPAENS